MNRARILKGVLLFFLTAGGVVLYFKGMRPSLLILRHRSLAPAVGVNLRNLPPRSKVNKRLQNKVNHRLKNELYTDNNGKVNDEVKVKVTPEEIHPSVSDHLTHSRELTNNDMLIKVKEDMVIRRKQIARTCNKLGFNNNSGSDQPPHLPRALVSERRAAVYCPVEKTASTFFRRFVYQLEHTQPMRSPFEVPVKMIYACHTLFTTVEDHAQTLRAQYNKQKRKQDRMRRRRRRKKHEEGPLPELGELIDDFLKRSTNFLFVRDPFSRLFSAYVDKLLAPNPEFWSSWGLFAIQKHRNDSSEKSQRCGHDATFAEFLKFVLDLDLTHKAADPHVRPIFELCRPCDVDYSVIGFMNTFQRDVFYLSSLLNVSETQLELDKMAADTRHDALQDSVMGAFTEWSNRLAECVPKGEVVRRIWRKLQIRGFISARVNFSPKMLKESIEFLEADDLIKILSKAVAESNDKEELHKQKMAAMISAYRTVDLEILRKIVHLYAADFRAFGFNERPSFLFDRPEAANNYSTALDFTSEWIV